MKPLPFGIVGNCSGVPLAECGWIGGGGVDILFEELSRREDEEVDSILIMVSFVLLLVGALLVIEGSSCGDIWPLLVLLVALVLLLLFVVFVELFGMNELLNGRPDRVKPVKS